jgi:hypothetical protein
MINRITGIVQTIVLVLALVGTTIAGDRYNDLEPEDGAFTRISPAYDLALRDLLLEEHHIRLCQMLVAPSFSPEWAVYLIRKDGTKGEAQVIYKVMKTQLWSEMPDQIEQRTNDSKAALAAAIALLKKPVDRASAPISESTTALLEQVWDEMLARVHYPNPDDTVIGLDGVNYHASHYKFGIGYRSGTTWSPEKGSNTGALIELAEELRRYAIADSKERPQIEAAIVKIANNLLAKLKKEHEKDTLPK